MNPFQQFQIKHIFDATSFGTKTLMDYAFIAQKKKLTKKIFFFILLIEIRFLFNFQCETYDVANFGFQVTELLKFPTSILYRNNSKGLNFT